MTCRCRASNRQPTADLDRHRTADTGVHLVEDERDRAAALGQHHLDGQPDPRHLPTGGDLAETARQRCPGWRENSRSTWSAPVGPSSIVRQLELQPGVRHRQRRQLAADALDEHRRRGRPGVVQLGRELGRAAAAARSIRAVSSPIRSSASSRSSSRSAIARSDQASTSSQLDAVLAEQPGQLEPSLGDLLQPTRLDLQVVEVARQIAGQVGQQVADLADPIGQRLGAGVGVGQPVGWPAAPRPGPSQRSAGLVVGAGDRLDRRVGRRRGDRRWPAAAAPPPPGRRPRPAAGRLARSRSSPNRSTSISRARSCASACSRSRSVTAVRSSS